MALVDTETGEIVRDPRTVTEPGDVEGPPEVKTVQSAVEAAVLLERAEQMVRRAQTVRLVRVTAAADAKALWKRQYARWTVAHQSVTPNAVRVAVVEGQVLEPEVVAEAAEIAGRVGLPGTGWATVGSLEYLYDLVKGMAVSAREAAEQWSDFAEAWRTVVVWSRNDADRELGR